MDATSVVNALGTLKDLPAPVVRWDVDEGTDASGGEAFWVWAVLKDADLTRSVRNHIRDAVWATVRSLPGADDRWVYVRFRGESEVLPVGSAR
jgi:hypothetical protein